MDNKNTPFEVYKKDVHPLVERITLICKQENIPMFMTFQDSQDSQDSFSSSCVNSDKSNFNKIQLHYWLHQTWSVDDMLRKIIEDARKNGHDSLYLKAMGIPFSPKSRA